MPWNPNVKVIRTRLRACLRQICREFGENPFNLARRVGFEQCLIDLSEDVDPIQAAIEVSYACRSEKLVVLAATIFLDTFLQRADDFFDLIQNLVSEIESGGVDREMLEEFFKSALLDPPWIP